MKTPFGIIYYPDLGLLLNKERLKQSEQIIDLNFSKKLPNGSEIQERKSEIKRIKWRKNKKWKIRKKNKRNSKYTK